MKINEGRISYAAGSGITYTGSIGKSSAKITRTIGICWRFENILWFWFSEQLWQYHVPHQVLVTSSSRKPGREVGMPRFTRDDMSILGNVFFDCQPARRVPDELHNDSRNLATSLVILRTEGIEKIESEEPLQSTPHLAFRWKHDKKYRQTMESVPFWRHVLKAWQFRVISPRRCIYLVFHTRMPRETVRQRGKKMEDARKSRLEQRRVLHLKQKIPCLRRARWKNIVA